MIEFTPRQKKQKKEEIKHTTQETLQNSNTDNPWLNLKEAAIYLKLNHRTLSNYVSKGLVPTHISVTGSKRFHKQELEQWISSTRKGFIPDY